MANQPRNPEAESPSTTDGPLPVTDAVDIEGQPNVGGLGSEAGGVLSGTPVNPASDAGPGAPQCVPTGQRDCASNLDNDCDGLSDATIDDVCRCTPGTVEACDEHPGFDGFGLCTAGTRTCFAAADGGIAGGSDWGPCAGAVGPGAADSCTISGDDTDCDGVPNEGCDCVDGTTQECGSSTDQGVCAFGTSTCVDGAFGPCVGAVPPAPRDSCAPNDDSNCNGLPNEGCGCIDGQTRSCGATDVGTCAFGTQTCVNGTFSGSCVGSVGPAARNCTAPADNDCDGRPDNTIDNVCQCTIGTSQVCGAHPQDGVGSCRAGSQQCQAGPGNGSSSFGQCQGSVGPARQDSCSSDGDDANCNGQENDGCECVGSDNAPCSGDPNASRCDGQGQCVPCQSDGDCALVAGGGRTCVAGECLAPVVADPFDCNDDAPPLPANRPLTNDAEGLPVPTLTGGTIADGRYTLEVVTYFGEGAGISETLDIRDGSYIRTQTQFDLATGSIQTGFTEAGTFSTTGSVLLLAGVVCTRGNAPSSETVMYTAGAQRLDIIRNFFDGRVRLESYTRSDL